MNNQFLSILLFGALLAPQLGANAFSPALASMQQSGHQRRIKPLRVAELTEPSTLDTFFQSQPYLAAFLTCSFKASTADGLAQLRSNLVRNESNDDCSDQANSLFPLDISRNLAFLLYGGIWQGMFQQFMFTQMYPIWFGTEHTVASIVSQVLFDTMIMGPCVFMPVCYSVKSLFSSDECMSGDNFVSKGLAKYRQDILEQNLLQLFWSIWIPAQIFNFSLVPSHLRVVFVAAVSFFWVCSLSTISSRATANKEPSIPVHPSHGVVPIGQHFAVTPTMAHPAPAK